MKHYDKLLELAQTYGYWSEQVKEYNEQNFNNWDALVKVNNKVLAELKNQTK